jgi:ribulose kinase
MAEGGQSATGALLHHIVTTHAAYPAAKQTATEQGITVFEYLNDQLENMRTEAKFPTLSHLTRYFFRMSPSGRSDSSLPRFCREQITLG